MHIDIVYRAIYAASEGRDVRCTMDESGSPCILFRYLVTSRIPVVTLVCAVGEVGDTLYRRIV